MPALIPGILAGNNMYYIVIEYKTYFYIYSK